MTALVVGEALIDVVLAGLQSRAIRPQPSGDAARSAARRKRGSISGLPE